MNDIRPGDIIEFVYDPDGEPVVPDEFVWSLPTKSWHPSGSNLVHTCVSFDGTTLTWFNERGLFHACLDAWDSVFFSRVLPKAVIPRTLG